MELKTLELKKISWMPVDFIYKQEVILKTFLGAKKKNNKPFKTW